MEDVAIIGVGLHPFGRFGDKSAIEMAADAVRAACARRRGAVEGRAVRVRGQLHGRQPRRGDRAARADGIPFMDVYNGCATAATALQLTADAIRSGKYDIGVAVGMDKHDAGAFTADPVAYGAPAWYGEMGYFLTTKFFGMKINRYMHDHGISHETLGRVAAKAFRNGALNPNAFRRKPVPEETIVGSRMLNYPLTQYMFCAPNEGAAAAVLCRADLASRYTSTPIYLRATTLRTRTYGAHEVHSTWAAPEQVDAPDGGRLPGGVRGGGHRPRPTSTSSSCRTPTPAPRSSTWPRTASAPTASRRSCSPRARPRSAARCRSTPTAGSSPTASRSGRRACARCTSWCCSCGARRATARCRGTPRVGYSQLYGAPGTAGVSILSV